MFTPTFPSAGPSSTPFEINWHFYNDILAFLKSEHFSKYLTNNEKITLTDCSI